LFRFARGAHLAPPRVENTQKTLVGTRTVEICSQHSI
jgi:hypothetical protein